MTGYFNETLNFGTTTLTATNSDIFLAKFDNTGNPLWAKNYNTGIQPEGGYSLTTDTANNVYFTGMFNGESLNLGNITISGQSGYNTIFIAKLDSNGNAVWGKGIKTYLNPPFRKFYDIAIDTNGDIIISGNYNSTATINGTTITTSGDGSFIAKYDQQGNFLWLKNTESNMSSIGALSIDINNNIHITGHHASAITFGNINFPNGGIFTAKYNSNGELIWAKSATCPGNEKQSFAIDTDTAGNVVITGIYKNGPITFASSTLPGAFSDTNTFTAKYDSTGNLVWAKGSSQIPNNFGSRGAKVKFDNVGNVYVYGYLSTDTTFDSIVLNQSELMFTSFLLRYDEDGNADWGKKINQTFYHSNDQYDDLIIKDDQIILSGICYDNAIFGSTTLESGGIFITKFGAPTLSNTEFTPNNTLLFPNPANDILTLSSKKNIEHVNIYNTLGQHIRSFNNINTEQFTIDISSLNPGYYFVEILSDQNIIQKKIIKE